MGQTPGHNYQGHNYLDHNYLGQAITTLCRLARVGPNSDGGKLIEIAKQESSALAEGMFRMDSEPNIIFHHKILAIATYVS